MLASNEGAYPEALDRGAAAIAEFARDGDVEAEATALTQHAVTLFLVGRISESRLAFEQVLPVFRSSGHVYRQAVVLGNLGSVAQAQGDLTAAEGWARESIALSDRLGDLEGGATNRVVLANIEIWSNRWERAEERLRVAQRLAVEAGVVNLEVDLRASYGVGLLEHGSGDPDDAVRFARETATAAAAETVAQPNRARAVVVLAYALLAAESAIEARAVLTAPAAEVDTGVAAQTLERQAVLVAADLALLPAGAAVPEPTRALARDVADHLDDEVLAAVLRPPSMLVALADALSGSPDPVDAAANHRALVLARAYLRRHLARPADDPGAAGFRSVPSVARLVERVGDVDPEDPAVARG